MNEILGYLTVAMILCYIPFVCYHDLKTRTFPFLYYTPLITLGLFTTLVYLLESPERNFYLLGLSVVLCGVVFGLALFKAIGGSDFFFASFIMLFVQYNPLKFPRIYFPLDFFWTLMLITVCLPLIIYTYNLFEYEPPKTFIGKLTHFPRGIPYMLPISIAFILTLLMEVLL